MVKICHAHAVPRLSSAQWGAIVLPSAPAARPASLCSHAPGIKPLTPTIICVSCNYLCCTRQLVRLVRTVADWANTADHMFAWTTYSHGLAALKRPLAYKIDLILKMDSWWLFTISHPPKQHEVALSKNRAWSSHHTEGSLLGSNLVYAPHNRS
jgi:hypothetical protein